MNKTGKKMLVQRKQMRSGRQNAITFICDLLFVASIQNKKKKYLFESLKN